MFLFWQINRFNASDVNKLLLWKNLIKQQIWKFVPVHGEFIWQWLKCIRHHVIPRFESAILLGPADFRTTADLYHRVNTYKRTMYAFTLCLYYSKCFEIPSMAKGVHIYLFVRGSYILILMVGLVPMFMRYHALNARAPSAALATPFDYANSFIMWL